MRLSLSLVALGAFAAGACADQAVPDTAGTPFQLDIAALSLVGVKDAVWDIKVENGKAETVFTARITSSQYGDNGGSASYVGTCDATNEAITGVCTDNNGVKTCTNAGITKGQSCSVAADCDTNVRQNRVTVSIRGIYDDKVALTSSGDNGYDYSTYGSGITESASVFAKNGALESLDFQNPGDLVKVDTCKENGDTFFKFDVALMRPAQQGFFDIAVNFNDIFCSAKFDCDTQPLLHDQAGVRGTTYVLGFACSAGGATNPNLLMDDIVIDCGGSNVTVVKPNAKDGNFCTSAGKGTGGKIAATETDPAQFPTGCTGLTEGSGSDVRMQSDPDGRGPLYQVAAYKGLEDVAGTTQHIAYWNIALGVESGTDVTLGNCTLKTKATVDDSTKPVLTGETFNVVTASSVYPYIRFDFSTAITGGAPTSLSGCGEQKMSFPATADTANVEVKYTTTASGGLVFGNTYNPGTCGDGLVDTVMGETCDDGDANDDAADKCKTTCAAPRCGDGFVDTGEICDAGANNGTPGSCNSTCSGTEPIAL
ncbi:MAG: hypothetical protein H6745_20145 [Deltaproteobacteria bacterium]|nr:hypothetical protein [Deltaproteobacteria bacterium]